jgi:ElaB/YqjD/DUF883 family membrane-anchored ribosome-binding protein
MHSQQTKPDSADSHAVLHPYLKSGFSASEPGTHAIRDQAGEVVEDVKVLGRVALDAGEKKIGDLRHQGDELLKHGRQEMENVQARVEGFVRERPMRAVLYAVGAGFIASLLLRR